MESLARNHPFHDGNKRIAVNASLTFLIVNGYQVLLDEKQAFSFIFELFESNKFTFAKLEPWLRENVYSSDEEPYAASTAMKSCLDALEELLFARQKLSDSLDKRNEEMSAITSSLTTEDSSVSIKSHKQWMLLTQRMTALFKRVTLDINDYSHQISSGGSKFLEGWATSVQWVEEVVPIIGDRNRLNNLLRLVQTFRTALFETRSKVRFLPENLYPLWEIGSDLPSALNSGQDSLDRMYKQFTIVFNDMKQSIGSCRNSHDAFDEQLAITSHSCDHLIDLVDTKLKELEAQGE